MSTDSFEAPSLDVLADLLPAYDFEAFIAQGGMGAVYKARQRSLDRDVAIKILPREFGEDPEFRQSFETEAKAMARLNHPNLIGVYDYGDVDGMPYIVMEFVNGKSLFHSAYHMAVEPLQAVTIVKGICDGLAHAHENGVVHRDIKPANILLNERVVPKIGDFGLARPAEVQGSGLVMGTPGYVAPEVLRHPEVADRRSDLFALGVVLYELLIGRCPPYDYQPPASTVCGCDVTLDRICDKAMHRVVELRYQSAEEMAADLDAWMRRASAPAGQAVAGPAKRPKGMRRVGAAAGSYRPAKAESSSGGMKGLLMLAAAVAIAAIGWSQMSGGDKGKSTVGQASAAEPTPAADKTGTAKPKADKKDSAASLLAKDDKADGETPTESLARLRAQLAEGKRDEMPKGSVLLGDSYFMVVDQPSSWTAAAAFATMHGAHLFIATTSSDIRRVTKLMPKAEDGAEAGLWIGAGKIAADEWLWVDGSKWELSDKPAGEGVYVIVDATGSLQMRERVDRYAYVIQWQKDGRTYAEVPDALLRAGETGALGSAKGVSGDEDLDTKDIPAEVAKLDATAKSYLEKIGKERDKLLADNAKNFTWGIDSWHKDLSKNDQAMWNRDVGLLKGLVKGIRVPAKVDPDSGVRLSDKMSKICDHCAQKQKDADAEHDSKADKARASYATRMAEQAKALTGAGDAKGAKAAEARVKKAANLALWTGFVIGDEEAAEAGELLVKADSPATEGKVDLSGRWVWMGADLVVVRPDGTLYNETNKNKGEWRRKEGGSERYEFSWNNGRWIDIMTVSSSGNTMRGSNQIGNDINAWLILKGKDPVVDAWLWGGALCVFRDDKTVSKGKDSGTWSLDSEEGRARNYTVRWQSGYVDKFTIDGDDDSFKGTNNDGNKISGKRVKE